MTALIKVSNHLALILPGERHFYNHKRCCSSLFSQRIRTLLSRSNIFTVVHFRFSQLSCSQIARNRELTEVAFPNGTAPKHSPAMLRPDFCGKWIVSLGITPSCSLRLYVTLSMRCLRLFYKSGAGIRLIKFLYSRNQSSYLRCWIIISRTTVRSHINFTLPNLAGSRIDHVFLRLDGSTKQEDREHAQPVTVARS